MKVGLNIENFSYQVTQSRQTMRQKLLIAEQFQYILIKIKPHEIHSLIDVFQFAILFLILPNTQQGVGPFLLIRSKRRFNYNFKYWLIPAQMTEQQKEHLWDDKLLLILKKASHKGFEELTTVLQALSGYSHFLGEKRDENKERQESRAILISKCLDALIADCRVSEEEEMDLLQQCFSCIVKLHSFSIDTASSNLRQLELNIIQKIADFSLKILVPSCCSQQYFIRLCDIVLNLTISNCHSLKQKRKQAKNKQSPILCHLYSGKKIELPWFFIIRTIQKISSQEGTSLEQTVKVKLKKYSNLLLEKIRQSDKQQWILSNLLDSLIDLATQMELPAVPVLIREFISLLIRCFRENFENTLKLPNLQQFVGKEIYSISNLSTIIQLTKVISTLPTCQMFKDIFKCAERCHNCSLIIDGKTVQVVQIQPKNGHCESITLKICQSCCKSLGSSPINNQNLIVLAPLILAQQTGDQNRVDLDYAKSCLASLLCLSCKAKKAEEEQLKKFLYENPEQTLKISIIEGLYKFYLFNHPQFSLENCIHEAFDVLLSMVNSKDDRLRLKALRAMSQPHVFDYLYSQHKKQVSPSLGRARQNLIIMLTLRLKDEDLTVRLVSLQLFLQVLSRKPLLKVPKREIFTTIYQSIIFCRDAHYIAVSLQVIEKAIRRIEKQNIKQQVQMLLKTIVFAFQCLNEVSKFNEAREPANTKICKLINTIYTQLSKICHNPDQSSQKDQQEICQCFALYLNENSTEDLSVHYRKIFIKMLKEIKLQATVLWNLPDLNPIILEDILFHTPQYTYQNYVCLQGNLNELLQLVFQEVSQCNQLLEISSNHSNIVGTNSSFKDVRNLLTSSYFIEKITKIMMQNENQTIFSCSQGQRAAQQKGQGNQYSSRMLCNKLRAKVLNFVLQKYHLSKTFSHCPALLSRVRKTSKGRKQWQGVQLIIVGSLEKYLLQLASKLIEEVKVTKIENIELCGSLLINLLFCLDRPNQITTEINVMHALNVKTIQILIEEPKGLYGSDIFRKAIGYYYKLIRGLAINASLVSTLENYLCLKEKIDSFEMRIEEKQIQRGQKHVFNIVSDKVSYSARMSDIFEKCYTITLQALNIDLSWGGEEYVNARSLIIQRMSLYWKAHPLLITNCGQFLKQLISREANINTILGAWQLLLRLLPSRQVRVLSAVNQCFTNSFQVVLGRKELWRQSNLWEKGLKLMQQVLRGGLSGVSIFTKHLYCGLFHQSQVAHSLSVSIINQAFISTGFQRQLFVNFSSNIRFLYNFLDHYNSYSSFGLDFSRQQLQGIKMLASASHISRKYYSLKDKRQLRLKPSFSKKIAEVIRSSPKMIQDQPLFLCFLLKIARSISIFDYDELYQLSFSLSKLVSERFPFIEKLRTDIEDHSDTERLIQKINILFCYREAVACLSYLCSYHQAETQMKNYHKLFQKAGDPYIELKQEVNMLLINPEETYQQIIDKLIQDIDFFSGILTQDILVSQNNSKRIPRDQQWEDQSTTQTQDKFQANKTKGMSRRAQRSQIGKTKQRKNLSQSIENYKPKAKEIQFQEKELVKRNTRARQRNVSLCV